MKFSLKLFIYLFGLQVEAKGTSAHTSTEVNMKITMGNVPLTISEGTI